MTQTKRKPATPGTTTIRCAVYTRKSTEEGLQQDFNTLDAQRESAQAYITAHKHEGWICLPDRYDDGGYTGGNLDRPAFKRLMADVEAGKVDEIVIYKIDRLSRSLMDFARVMEILERHNVALIAITQSLDTKTSMGRLTLNVLLSFPSSNARSSRNAPGTRLPQRGARGNGPAGCRCSATTRSTHPAAQSWW